MMERVLALVVVVDHWVEHQIPCRQKSRRLQEQEQVVLVDIEVAVVDVLEPFGFEPEEQLEVVLEHC